MGSSFDLASFGQDYARGTHRIEVEGKRLAQFGWVTPMSLMPADTFEILEAKTARAVDRRFIDLYERSRRRYFNETLRDMLKREELRPWRKLIREAADAYRRAHYALTVPALLTIIEGVVMRADGRGKKRRNPLQVLDRRIKALRGH
jgi:hypothetical protein